MQFKLKVFGVIAAFALVVSAGVPAANALTTSELIDLLVSLGIIPADKAAAAQAAAGGSSSSSSSSCSLKTAADMTIGSTGASVVELQTYLESMGYLTIPAGVSKGYFGSMTQSALAKYQAAMGISPASGYFGPITKASITCSTSDDSSDDSSSSSSNSTLSGSQGDIQSVSKMSDFSSEEVGEGENDVEVLGVEIEAEDGSDLSIESVRLTFTKGAGSGSNRFERYAEEVTIWLDGKEVGSVNGDDFSRTSTGVYTKTVSLSNAVIERGEKGELVVAVSAISNLDSDDEGEDWNVEIDSVRFSDASGAVLTYIVNTNEDFTFESLATASDLELKIALDGTPKAKVVDVNATTKKTGVELLAFTLEAKGADMWIDEIPVEFVTTGDPLNAMLTKVTLVIDGKSYNENVTATSPIIFDDLDFDLDKGDKVEVQVLADINGANSFNEGSSVTASITQAERENIVVEDANGDSLKPGDRTGTANGEEVAFYDEGIFVEVVELPKPSVGTAVSGQSDTGTYTIVFEVTAFGDDMYIFDTAATTGNTSNTVFTVSNPSTVTDVSGTLERSDSNSTDEGDRYKIVDGKTAKFTLTVAATAETTSGFHNVQLDSVAWTSSDIAPTGTAYTFDLGSNAKTDNVNLIAR